MAAIYALNGVFQQLIHAITHSVYVLSASIVVAFSGLLQQVQWERSVHTLSSLIMANLSAVLWCLLAGFVIGVLWFRIQLLQLQCDTERLERMIQQGRTLSLPESLLQPDPVEPVYAAHEKLNVTQDVWTQWPGLSLALPVFDKAVFHIQYRAFMRHALTSSPAYVGTLQTRLQLELLDANGQLLPAVYSGWDVSNSRSHACQGAYLTEAIRTVPAGNVLPGSARVSVQYQLVLPPPAVRDDNPSQLSAIHTGLQTSLCVRVVGVKAAL